jgi:hypothetical protein
MQNSGPTGSSGPCVQPRAQLLPAPLVHSDLAPAAAPAAADEDRSAPVVETVLGESERFLDAQPGAPQHDDHRSHAPAVPVIGRVAHDRHDLVDRGRVRWIATRPPGRGGATRGTPRRSRTACQDRIPPPEGPVSAVAQASTLVPTAHRPQRAMVYKNEAYQSLSANGHERDAESHFGVAFRVRSSGSETATDGGGSEGEGTNRVGRRASAPSGTACARPRLVWTGVLAAPRASFGCGRRRWTPRDPAGRGRAPLHPRYRSQGT